jgi:predicted small lipoprotein YifL
MSHRTRYLLWVLLAALGAGTLLAACGNKGDLYLPDRQAERGEGT